MASESDAPGRIGMQQMQQQQESRLAVSRFAVGGFGDNSGSDSDSNGCCGERLQCVVVAGASACELVQIAVEGDCQCHWHRPYSDWLAAAPVAVARCSSGEAPGKV